MAKASSKKSKKNARLIRRGDIIEAVLADGADPVEDVVRSVDIVIRLAGGGVLTVPTQGGDDVTVIEEPPIDETLLAELQPQDEPTK